jgi:hypothetical protein
VVQVPLGIRAALLVLRAGLALLVAQAPVLEALVAQAVLLEVQVQLLEAGLVAAFPPIPSIIVDVLL